MRPPSTPPPPRRDYARLLLALFIGALGLWLLGDAAWARWRNGQALAWASTPGVVTESALRVRHGSRGRTTYTPWLTYRYAVAGAAHLGHRINFGAAATGRARAEALVARYPVGRPVAVYPDPRDPGSAILEPGPIPGLGGELVAGLVGLLLGVALSWLAWNRSAWMALRSSG